MLSFIKFSSFKHAFSSPIINLLHFLALAIFFLFNLRWVNRYFFISMHTQIRPLLEMINEYGKMRSNCKLRKVKANWSWSLNSVLQSLHFEFFKNITATQVVFAIWFQRTSKTTLSEQNSNFIQKPKFKSPKIMVRFLAQFV